MSPYITDSQNESIKTILTYKFPNVNDVICKSYYFLHHLSFFPATGNCFSVWKEVDHYVYMILNKANNLFVNISCW